MKYNPQEKCYKESIVCDAKVLDFTVAQALKSRLITCYEEGKTPVALNLEGVEYMQTSALSTFVGLLQEYAHEASLEWFDILNLQPQPRRLIETVGLEKVLPHFYKA
jgi:anti-anti-sigma factor